VWSKQVTYIVTQDDIVNNLYSYSGSVNKFDIRVISNSDSSEVQIPLTYDYIAAGYMEDYVTALRITTKSLRNLDGAYYVGADGHEIQVMINPNARDPTYQEVVDFIKKDKTDQNKYIPDKYVCIDFAEDVQHNAAIAGYNCGFDAVDFTSDAMNHMCNVFNTVDRGLVYIDCTASTSKCSNNDCYVIIEVGKPYQPMRLYDVNDDCIFLPMGIVASHQIYWE